MLRKLIRLSALMGGLTLLGLQIASAQSTVPVIANIGIAQKDGDMSHFIVVKVIRHPTYGIRGAVMVTDSAPSYRISGSSRTIIDKLITSKNPNGTITIVFTIGLTFGQVIVTPATPPSSGPAHAGKVVFQTKKSSTAPWVTERIFTSTEEDLFMVDLNQ